MYILYTYYNKPAIRPTTLLLYAYPAAKTYLISEIIACPPSAMRPCVRRRPFAVTRNIVGH